MQGICSTDDRETFLDLAGNSDESEYITFSIDQEVVLPMLLSFIYFCLFPVMS